MMSDSGAPALTSSDSRLTFSRPPSGASTDSAILRFFSAGVASLFGTLYSPACCSMADSMLFLISGMANAANPPFSGLYFSAAFIIPNIPSLTRSSSSSPRPWYFRAVETTSPMFSTTILFLSSFMLFIFRGLLSYNKIVFVHSGHIRLYYGFQSPFHFLHHFWLFLRHVAF